MKNIAFYYIFSVILVNSIAIETLQDGVFKSVKTNIKLAKNETRNSTYVPPNSTSFLGVLQKIKRELDELTKSWKRQQQEMVTKFSKAFRKKGFNEKAWRFLDTRRKRSPIQTENGFSEEIMRMIEGLVTFSFYFDVTDARQMVRSTSLLCAGRDNRQLRHRIETIQKPDFLVFPMILA
jgi:hypothetical protein